MRKLDKWKFIGDNGEFKVENIDQSTYLYFPLANEAEMMSAITPRLHGDIKTGQNTFAMRPVSLEDLHNTKSARNFWLKINDQHVWSAAGNSAAQFSNQFSDEAEEDVELEAGLLWHKITRSNSKLNVQSEITNFVPTNSDTVELMRVKIKNTGAEELKIEPTAAVPIYGRSADNLRDHRHVTSLLHRTKTIESGVVVKPTLSFDERGHKQNEVSYAVLGGDENGKAPAGFFPVLEDYIGDGGNLEWPEAVVKSLDNYLAAGEEIDGYETVGALRFDEVTLKAGEEISYVLAVAIAEEDIDFDQLAAKYCSGDKFEKYLTENRDYWQQKLAVVDFDSADQEFDQWMKWVTLQPILRRIYGCSFLPSHDYGRGGRGWRDLWQDCLALLLMEPEPVSDLLYNNFSGVRIDGSNATIIGSEPGEFKADRNDIKRVWMDHGAWPLLTTKLYIDQSGDLEFLLKEQSYFEAGSELKDKNDEIYQGSVIEHFLVQHLTHFFDVGEHNNFLLKNGDWNDGLDMAENRGESVAFTALYGSNLLELAELLKALSAEKSIEKIELAEELSILLDTIERDFNYQSVDYKREVLSDYRRTCKQGISGRKIEITLTDLISDLESKGQSIFDHLNKNEWIETEAGDKFYNGYYDDDGQRLEGDHPKGVRMTLTGQVFPVMAGAADEDQIQQVVDSADKYLKDLSVGGYRLNTDFKELKTNLGRLFGFAYGHKENGAMFSHMAVMYSNALYKQGFAEAGHKVIDYIYQHCRDFDTSRTYPGIPEYINQRGRGMYPYLTGSASWLLLTVVTQIFGVRGELGNLILDPKLLKSHFDDQGEAAVKTIFADKLLNITYLNTNQLEAAEYQVQEVKINGQAVGFENKSRAAVIERSLIADSGEEELKIEVVLS
ncbi:GH36-type glycosyl hydrolase domain-containing protein [Halanaerobium sp. ST460_2HS_T2]|uniref:GH36-type glycosyl hydrolase domain-containing protein n=1 Tax=Halanaerobium sp. ST460_2HS_T2 TaxID=2183914 RepID=UPI000DF23292|nr:cellobiose phosphorylase [Halanaerobium sp. ST460_2HS_T2]RCW56523.1 glycosyl transferase family 36 [Halanaerobium sp. ST460_2HS_T2]